MQDRRKGSRIPTDNSVLSTSSNNSTEKIPVFLSREALATRWSVSTRTVDRRRQDGILPWVDLNRGRGRKPIVRFLLKDIEEYEGKGRLEIT